jgi:hypothetical protein
MVVKAKVSIAKRNFLHGTTGAEHPSRTLLLSLIAAASIAPDQKASEIHPSP